MRLYHGTTATIAKKALCHGLKPRGTEKGNWQHSSPSHPEMIYLSTIYAGYFAINAQKTKHLIGLVEVDMDELDTDLLRPDEDFIEQATRGKNNNDIPDSTLERRTKFICKRIDDYAPNWENSIKFLGNCAYKGTIPPEAITRVSIVNLKLVPQLATELIQPTITIANYKFCKNVYESLNDFCFWKKFTVDEFMAIQNYGLNFEKIADPKLKGMFKGQRQHFVNFLKRQDKAVTVIENR